MANAIWTQRYLCHIPAISILAGIRAHDSIDTAESFRAFYEALYNLHPRPSVDRPQNKVQSIDAYLADANLPSFNAEEVELLSQPLTTEELASALAGSPKAPSPDGFTIYYYKTIQAQLATHFVTAFNATLVDHTMPPELLQANMTVIHKPEKDPLLCAS